VKLLVIVPAYREAEVIADVVREVRVARPDAGLVVVDDCSPDDTGERARRAGARVIRLSVNLGIGGAVQTGFKYADRHGYDVAVQVDGDGQHDPAELPKILGPLAEGRSDVVIGWRFVEGTGYRAPLARRLGMWFFSAVAHRAVGQRISDTTSGFRALGREPLRFLARNYPVDFPDAESLVLLHRAGFRLLEVPVRMRPRRSGRSSTGTLRSVYYPFKQLLSILVVVLRKRPDPLSKQPGGESPRGP
jgi:glycosyltransferase involved in cell wall biosynthesis